MPALQAFALRANVCWVADCNGLVALLAVELELLQVAVLHLKLADLLLDLLLQQFLLRRDVLQLFPEVRVDFHKAESLRLHILLD